MISMRRRPRRSAKAPAGISNAANGRIYALTTHSTSVNPPRKSRAMDGSEDRDNIGVEHDEEGRACTTKQHAQLPAREPSRRRRRHGVSLRLSRYLTDAVFAISEHESIHSAIPRPAL